mgnify:CR=1 FL=1
MFELLYFTALALLLGFKHSYDADHLMAVSNLLRRAGSMRRALWLGFSWSIGHAITAGAMTVLLYHFREFVFQEALLYFEYVVGAMLVALGLYTLWSLTRNWTLHSHRHAHGSLEHEHIHIHRSRREEGHLHYGMLGIGLVHGLASNDELLLLLTTSLSVRSFAGMLFGVIVFSIGVVVGMVAFSALFTYPLLRAHSEKITATVELLVGLASVAYGALVLMGA